jgi:hypothetical protein
MERNTASVDTLEAVLALLVEDLAADVFRES